jgi:hypothetical protein
MQFWLCGLFGKRRGRGKAGRRCEVGGSTDFNFRRAAAWLGVSRDSAESRTANAACTASTRRNRCRLLRRVQPTKVETKTLKQSPSPASRKAEPRGIERTFFHCPLLCPNLCVRWSALGAAAAVQDSWNDSFQFRKTLCISFFKPNPSIKITPLAAGTKLIAYVLLITIC